MSNKEISCCFHYEGNSCPYENVLDSKLVLNIDQQSNKKVDFNNGQLPHYTNVEGKQYCIFHAPGEIKERLAFDNLNGTVVKQFRALLENASDKDRKLIGVVFPPRTTTTIPIRFVSEVERFTLIACHFQKTQVTFQKTYTPVCIDNPTIHGNVSFDDFQHLILANTQIDHKSSIALVSRGVQSRLLIHDCQFNGGIDLNAIEQCKSLHIRKTDFNSNIQVTQFLVPKDTTLDHVKFARTAITAIHESQFRHLREQFSKQQARYLEGQMYILEQRCHRKNLRWYYPSLWFHWLYDVTSAYGFSYERLLFGIIGIQAIFWVYYDKVFSNNHSIKPIQYVFSQLFKPYELLSLKMNANAITIPKEIIEQTNIVLWSTVQTTITYIMFALFLLALRWRFKRG